MSRTIRHAPCRWGTVIVAILILAGCRVETPEPISSLTSYPVPTSGPSAVTASPDGSASGPEYDHTPAVPPNPCSLPCWYDIIPGETDFDQAQQTLSALPFASDHWTYDRGTGRMEIRWVSEHDDEMIMDGGVVLDDGLVITAYVNDSRQLTTADDILAQYGSPDQIVAYTEGVEAVFFNVLVLYPERGLGFIAEGLLTLGGETCLDSESPIFYFQLTSPGTIDDYFEQAYDLEGQRERVRSKLIPWPGFGCKGFSDQ
jgi:hypothetical protein